MQTSRPPNVHMTRSASFSPLPAAYNSAAYRIGMLVPDARSYDADHTVSSFADPHPSSAQLQLARQQYTLRMTEWQRHVQTQHTTDRRKLKSEQALLEEDNVRAVLAAMRRSGKAGWLDARGLGMGAPKGRGSLSTIGVASMSSFSTMAAGPPQHHRPPPSMMEVDGKHGSKGLTHRPPPPQPAAMGSQENPGSNYPTDAAREPLAPSPAVPSHRAPPTLAPNPAVPSHRAPPTLAPKQHRAPPSKPPARPSVIPSRAPPPLPLQPPESTVDAVFDGEAMAVELKSRKQAEAARQVAARQHRLGQIATPALKKDLRLIANALDCKHKHMHEGFRKMRRSSTGKSSALLSTEQLSASVKRLGLPISEEHVLHIAELMGASGEDGLINLADFAAVLRGQDYEGSVIGR